MKQIKTIVTAILLVAAVTSCKKENDMMLAHTPAPTPIPTPTPPAPTASIKLIKTEYADGSNTRTYTYDASGRLAKINGGTLSTNYSYSPDFSYETLRENGSKLNDISNVVIVDNRIASYNYNFYPSSGGQSSELTTFKYDANGYLVKYDYSGYVYDFTINNGNTTELKYTDPSGTVRTTVYEYYTDKTNKMNINLLENWYFSQLASDKSLTGKQNTNLPKKITYTSPSSNIVTELSYVINADGLPTQMTSVITENGGTPKTSILNFTYQ